MSFFFYRVIRNFKMSLISLEHHISDYECPADTQLRPDWSAGLSIISLYTSNVARWNFPGHFRNSLAIKDKRPLRAES
ncbi:hypothetical protein JOB18_024887 [Solea senegalensis]|uniref:Uncharacterized protein n=1 Tax=Solea senegalensis TaxID=28829 RepID=A0AAV6SKY2_SOLSE|nr:hypothetical protein JOB18_024887 [Solea senegalensis]